MEMVKLKVLVRHDRDEKLLYVGDIIEVPANEAEAMLGPSNYLNMELFARVAAPRQRTLEAPKAPAPKPQVTLVEEEPVVEAPKAEEPKVEIEAEAETETTETPKPKKAKK